MRKRVVYKGKAYPTAAAEIQEPTHPESKAAFLLRIQVGSTIRIAQEPSGAIVFQAPDEFRMDDLLNALRNCFAERDMDSRRWKDQSEESETRRRFRE